MKRYARIPTDDEQTKELVQYGMNKIPSAAIAVLDVPITIDELFNAVRKEKTGKSSGQEGICNEFYRTMWDMIKQDMLEVIDIMYVSEAVTRTEKWDNCMHTEETGPQRARGLL